MTKFVALSFTLFLYARKTATANFELQCMTYSIRPYRPQNTPPPQRRPGGGGASATNVRITKAILDSILLNPEHFTQITHDKPPHLCTFLKVSYLIDIFLRKKITETPWVNQFYIKFKKF